MGIAGITLSTTFVTLFNAILLGLFIFKKIELDYGVLFKDLFKMIFAGAITFAIVLIFSQMFNSVDLPKYVFELTKILVITITTAIIYLGMNMFLKVSYAKELFNRLMRK